MKNGIVRACKDKLVGILISIRPVSIYRGAKKLILKISNPKMAGIYDMKRYQKGWITKERVAKYHKVLLVKKGLYEYDYFNICFLNNMLSFCLKAVSEGYIPRIQVMNSKNENIWDMYFEQPYADIPLGNREVAEADPQILEAFPEWSEVHNPEMVGLYGRLYHDFARLNSSAEQYVKAEMQEILSKGRILGVLCRGTDYTKSKPKGHPIQPTTAEILDKCDELLQNNQYDYIYLATEDSEYDRQFRDKFGDHILTNKRQYYDKAFREQDISLIKDVHFDRENDEYLKGLEYLSSLWILSSCQGLVAGNCGGTEAAVFWNQGKYEDCYIFDLGIY